MGTSAKALKLRIKSVQSTEHITRAMQLVASSKLRRATEKMEVSRSYFSSVKAVFSDLAAGCGRDAPEAYFRMRSEGKVCVVVIAGDRGLAGGYNNNIFNLVKSIVKKEEAEVLPIGKKAYEYFKKKEYTLIDGCESAEGLTMDRCAKMGKTVTDGYKSGRYRQIYLVYTSFRNMLSQSAEVLQVLPLSAEEKKKGSTFVLYEPSPAAVFEAVIPEYAAGLIYCALCESGASEQAARRNAMDSATKNANEMIERLGLQFNRARQGAITQEITEIVAGSEQA